MPQRKGPQVHVFPILEVVWGQVERKKRIVQRHPLPPIPSFLHVRLLPVELLQPYGEAVGILMVFSMREL